MNRPSKQQVEEWIRRSEEQLARYSSAANDSNKTDSDRALYARMAKVTKVEIDYLSEFIRLCR